MSAKLDGICKLLGEFAPGSPHWTVEEAPDQTGKVILITGGNSGIGFETAKALLDKNATVYIGCRSISKGNEAVAELQSLTGNSKVHILQMDLGDLPTIPKAVDEFKKKETKLHMLINNAGIMTPPMDDLTTQGYDAQFGVNVLGHYLFTKLLLPLLESTAASLPASQPVRVIELTSDYHLLTSGTGEDIIKYNTLRDGPARRRSTLGELYGQSKSGNILVTNARARLIQGRNIVFISVHPGHIASNLQRNFTGLQAMSKSMLSPTWMGAINSVWAATAPDATRLNGKYIGPWAREKAPRKDHVSNPEAEDKLIAYLEEQLRVNNVPSSL